MAGILIAIALYVLATLLCAYIYAKMAIRAEYEIRELSKSANEFKSSVFKLIEESWLFKKIFGGKHG